LAVTSLGAAFIASKNGGTQTYLSSSNEPPASATDRQPHGNEPDFIPEGCFRNKFELGTAVTELFDGTNAFRESVIRKYGNISDFCVDYVDDFSFLFAYRSFNQDISGWNVSRSKSFAYTFTQFPGLIIEPNRTRFNPDVSRWDVSRSKSFRAMFAYALDFNADLSRWNTSQSLDFTLFCNGCLQFNSDLNGWQTGNTISFSNMFHAALAFDGGEAGLAKWDVSSGRDFSSMFLNSAFNGDISGWDLSSGRTFEDMLLTSKFNQNLCAWVPKFRPDSDFWLPGMVPMFGGNECKSTLASLATMCFNCLPTSSPSASPSQTPTTSISPTTSTPQQGCLDTTFLNASGFSGQENLVDFERLDNEAVIANQYISMGVGFSQTQGGEPRAVVVAPVGGVVLINYFLGNPGDVVLSFLQPQSRVGFEVITEEGDETVIVLSSGGTSIQSPIKFSTGVAGFEFRFVGVESSVPFYQVRIVASGIGRGFVMMDNVRFEADCG